MKFEIQKINTSSAEYAYARHIRHVVFVDEQGVSPKDEYDEHDANANHFLLQIDDDEVLIPCGTARWRITEHGVKLERFAVLSEHRGNKMGQALVNAVLEDIHQNTEANKQKLYLHAQLQACSLYERFGFLKEGDMFEECDIQHFKMVKN